MNNIRTSTTPKKTDREENEQEQGRRVFGGSFEQDRPSESDVHIAQSIRFPQRRWQADPIRRIYRDLRPEM